jgi:hypothetical protein
MSFQKMSILHCVVSDSIKSMTINKIIIFAISEMRVSIDIWFFHSAKHVDCGLLAYGAI